MGKIARRVSTRALVFIALAAPCALATSCGGGGGGQSSEALADVQKASCDRYVAAVMGIGCSGPQYPADDLARLQANIAPLCAAAFSLPGSTVTPAQVDACSAALTANDCARFLSYQLPDACSFRGSLAAGAACSASTQCQSGFCGFDSMPAAAGGAAPPAGANAACGHCVDPAAAGAPCPFNFCVENAGCVTAGTGAGTCVDNGAPVGSGANCSQAACQDGLACSSTSSVCVARAAAGAPCAADTDCQAGLFCQSGACAGPLSDGQTCSGNTPFDLECALGLTCQAPPSGAMSAGGVCKAAPAWKMPGESCDTGMCLHGSCIDMSGSGSGPFVCQALVADGQACSVGGGSLCDSLSACVNGTCQIIGNFTCKNQPAL